MSDTAKVCQEWFERVWNQKDATAIDELLSDPCEVHMGKNLVLRSREEYKELHKNFCSTFDKFHTTIKGLVTEGKSLCAVVRFEMVKNHVSYFVDVGCHGKVKDGQIYYAYNVVDYMELLDKTGFAGQDLIQAAMKKISDG